MADLQLRRCDAVFDRQIALDTLQISRDERWCSRYKNQVLLVARAGDSNGAGQIDRTDEAHVFIFDMLLRKITQFTPDGWSVESIVEFSGTLTVILRGSDGGYAICRGFPIGMAGQIIVDSITP